MREIISGGRGGHRAVRALGVAVVLAVVGACGGPGGLYGRMGVATAPAKRPSASDTELARQARGSFWAAFEGDDYAALPEAQRLLTAAYLERPSDGDLAMLLGMAHLWRVSERARDPAVAGDPRVTDGLVLADFYLGQAQALRPDDRRIEGWRGSVEMALGTVHNDQRVLRTGYFRLRDAAAAYPEFNGFTLGYAMSATDLTDPAYGEAVEAVWRATDACVGGRLDRGRPDMAPHLAAETTGGDKRVCWNGPRAPHNFEGFWFNMGLMLLKQGEVEAGKTALRNAALAESYGGWRYRGELERALAEADELAGAFARREPAAEERLMFNSAWSCVACHAR